MSKIRLLPDHIIAQIAAGEVIERPAYVVKELVENAIDAGADSIQVYLEDGGLKKIMVIDNGEGMSEKDLALSYQHHTTSKLSTDLHNIRTLGFRGEALWSIAAVSTMSIKSKPANAASGYSIEIVQGKKERMSPVGMPQGTTVIVDQLFAKVPGRKKFLKSSRSEYHLALTLLIETSLAYPHIRFQLWHNAKLIIDYPKVTNPEERMKSLLGEDIFQQMIPVKYTNDYISITGYTSKPHLISTTTSKQYMYINNRRIQDKQIGQAAKDGYNRLLDSTSFPIFVLRISLPPEMIDVNVHPRKEQVAYVHNDALHQTIKTAIENALTANNITFLGTAWDWKNMLGNENMPKHATSVLRDEMREWNTITKIVKNTDIFQMHNLYLLVQTYNGFLLIDQHAAHERVLYEKLAQSFKGRTSRVTTFTLESALSLHLSPQEVDVLHQHKQLCQNFGFVFEEFGNDHIKIVAVPSLMKDHDIPSLVREFVSDLLAGEVKPIDSQSEKMLAYLACRSAVKAGDPLTKKQRKELLEQLDHTPNNFTCPHGRPTKVELSLREIHRFFKR